MRKFKNNKLIVATHNLGKYEEICDLFSDSSIKIFYLKILI